MRNVTLAKSAGFCFGVSRAVKMVYEEAEKDTICTYGPIIHNNHVVSELESKGVHVISSPEEGDGKTVVIRAHGIEENIYDLLVKRSKVIDATCPFVKKIHTIVHEKSMEGMEILVIGNPEHPEVRGIVSRAHTKTTVIETEHEAENFKMNSTKKLCIVAQTTFNYRKFKDLVEIISEKGYDIIAVNTICNATEERQREARELASNSDCMIVIGDSKSSNSQKLYQICKNECINTFFIQTVDDLDIQKVQSFSSLGITAGASTPNIIIQEVLEACRK